MRDQGFVELGLDSVGDEVSKGFGVEFITSDLALGGPEMAVGVEDTVAKELVEDGGVTAALDVVGEVGAEEVVEVGGIGGTNTVGEAQEAVNLECQRRGGTEHVGDPIMEAVAVAEEGDDVSDEWVGLRRWGFDERVVAAGVPEEESGDREYRQTYDEERKKTIDAVTNHVCWRIRKATQN